MKFELKKTWHLLSCLVGGFIVIPILAFSFIAVMYRLDEIPLLNSIIPKDAGGKVPADTLNNSAETIRNFAWIFWMLLSFYGATLGLWLAWWGRHIQNKQWKTQHKSHLQERFEKASEMLSSELEATRIAACLSLADLGKADESMKSRCARLLFAFINNPYLDANDKGKSFDELFPDNKPLRSDIQQAIASFSAIYERYSDEGIDKEIVNLPSYFWKNKHKGSIFLAKTNLWNTTLEEANLRWSNLEGISLERANLKKSSLRMSKLRGADLTEAYMQGADISDTDMREIKNLTKKQILSTTWGYDRYRCGGPPQLSEDLMQDEDIKKWLESPHYDYREPEDSQ